MKPNDHPYTFVGLDRTRSRRVEITIYADSLARAKEVLWHGIEPSKNTWVLKTE